MENQKEYCENLYQEYKKLNNQIQSKVGDPREELESTNVDEIDKLRNLKDELKECLDLLAEEYLIELSGESDFMEEAGEILRKRKAKN